MCTGDGRHDGTVDDPKFGYPVNLELRIDNRVPVRFRSHFAGTRLMVHLHGQSLYATSPIQIRAVFQMPASRYRPRVQRGSQFLESRRFVQVQYHFDPFHDTIQIHGFIEEIRPDQRFRIGIGVSQSDLERKNGTDRRFVFFFGKLRVKMQKKKKLYNLYHVLRSHLKL